MIIKGKNKADIAKRLGISRQAFSQMCKRYNNNGLFIDDDGVLSFDTSKNIPNRSNAGAKPRLINYEQSFAGDFITRKEYSEKYNIRLQNIGKYINNKRIFTTKDGKLVSDIPYKKTKI